MNNFYQRGFILLMVCLLGLPYEAIFAQHTKVDLVATPTPPPPAIAPVPDGFSWTTNYQYVWDIKKVPASASSLPPSPMTKEQKESDQKLVLAKSNHFSSGVLEEETLLKDRSTSKRLFVKNLIIINGSNGEFLVEPISSYYEGRTFRPNTFNDFYWLENSVFSGETVYQGVACYVYRQLGADGNPVKSAFISKDRKLPVGLEDSFGIQLYQFKEDKTPIEIPPGALQSIQKATQPVPSVMDRYKLPQ